MIIGMRDEDREVVMDYEQQATQWANAGSGSAGNAAAITFAVLHLAEQVERLADCLDQITDDRPGSQALRVTVLR
jgi:hypothetical protein